TFAIIISFFSFLSINYMLITPLSHIWLIILAIHYIKKIFNEMDSGQCKNPYALAIFMIIVPILIVGMFMVFDESYSGVPRAKREVIAYLKEERGYTDKDINSAIVNNIEKDKELVFIAFNDEPEVLYRYAYKNGKVYQYDVIEMEPHKDYRHKE
uniref:hypothetical protein n=1 Tax=Clostridiisalibacter paucivorans TaxID=408753 RepID=UPI00047A5DC8